MNNAQKLWSLAKTVYAHAYCPYSNFAVGAAILADDGNFYSGCNVENAAYPEGSCAETGAISAMISGGARQIKEILILGNGSQLLTPCGGCRQRIKEFSSSETLIHLADDSGICETLTIDQLLPCSFTKESFNHD